ncbi:MAG: hypothetical protein H0T53_11555, partial [Herpetosiphonaceae bacterium]|nr:hypothetical protein [Herpetosiphonaceae bacterium]
VLTANLDAPPPPEPELPVAALPTPSPTPGATPSPAGPADQLYALVDDYSTEPFTTHLLGRAADSSEVRLRLKDVVAATLTPDGQRLYALYRDGVSAIDTSSGDQLWHVSIPDMNLSNPLYQSRSSLALSQSGGTLAVYRQNLDADAGPVGAWIDRIDTFSGRWLRRSRIELGSDVAWFGRLLSAADTATFYLASPYKLQAIDVDSHAVTTLLESPTGRLAADMNPAGTRLLVAVDGRELIEYDALNSQELRRSSLGPADLRPANQTLRLLISPDDTQIALMAHQQGQPAIHGGQRMLEYSGDKLVIIDRATGALRQQTGSESEWWQALAWSSDSGSLYLMNSDRIKRWDLSQDRFDIQPSGERWPLTHMLVGPYVAPAAPSSPPLPAHVPATPAPTASPAPLVEAEAAPFAWVFHGLFGDQKVVEYATDGSATTIAERVITAIPRLGQPPLLLTMPKIGSWAVFDPVSATTTPLSMTVPYDSTPSTTGFILSPDGTQLAMITERDPIPADALTDLRQLAVVDLRSGQVRALAGFERSSLSEHRLAAWGAEGIYVYTIKGDNQIVALQRVDPAEPGTPATVMEFPDGANAVINASADLLLYEPYPADLEQSELRLRDLRSGSESIIYTGTFIDRSQMLIAPDGSAVVYSRPLDEYQAEVLRYDVAAGTTRRLTTVASYQTSRLRWDADGQQLIVRSASSYDYTSTLQEMLFSPDGTLAHQWQVPRNMLDWASAPVTSADGQRSVDVAYASGDSRLNLHAIGGELATAPRLRVSIPLETYMRQWDSPSPLVYVP